MKQISANDCATNFRNYQEIFPLGKRPREKKLKIYNNDTQKRIEFVKCSHQRHLIVISNNS